VLSTQFGFLPPSDSPGAAGNLGVKDVVTALQFIRDTVFWFGGNPLGVVVGGQSSGGHMIRGKSFYDIISRLVI